MEIGAENDASAQKNNQEDQLKSARAEVGEAREENERLKLLLGQLVKDYQSLHMHFLEVLQQKVSKKLTDVAPNTNIDDDHDQENEDEEPDLVSLSLGRRSSNKNSKLSSDRDHKDQDNEKLELGLDCRLFGLNYSAETTKKTGSRFDHSLETWPPSKILKRARSDIQDVDEVLQKKARVSIRARCDTQTMNDGCQWRKYGQKTAKGNPCPRAYYRCTVSPTCPVRKQVQRCAEDMSILITTYEGNHNHPLPISASAMASTTSAAASMLISRSSSSSQPLHGLSFAAFASHPTCITLDLTAPTTTFSNFSALPSSSSSSSQTFHQTPWRQQLSQERLCSSQNTSLTDTVAKVITSNPTFRSALTAALTSSFLNHHQQGS